MYRKDTNRMINNGEKDVIVMDKKILILSMGVILMVLLCSCSSSATGPVETNDTVFFSGYEWTVKHFDGEIGPGPNYFSNSRDNVWTDAGGRLHLKITKRDDKWYCAEIVLKKSLGYGTYRFTLSSPVDQLDKNAVLGLFVYDLNAADIHHREIDVEFSRWGYENGLNTQYVIQPWDKAENREQFNTQLTDVMSTHEFIWSENEVSFSSYNGKNSDQGEAIHNWSYNGSDNPVPGDENVRINLWLFRFDENFAYSGPEIEIIVDSFEFLPQ